MQSLLACEDWLRGKGCSSQCRLFPLPYYHRNPLSQVANCQTRPMYECIQVYSYHEQESVLNEEGDLDNESEDSEFEAEMIRKSRNRDSVGSDASIVARCGSPMLDDW